MAVGWKAIPHKERLVDHGPSSLREYAVDILEHGIRAADPYAATEDLIHVDGDRLRIGPLSYHAREFERMYVIGAGKATQPIAMRLEECLGGRIDDGVVVLKRGESHQLQKIRVLEAAHPVPDDASFVGGQELMRLARSAGQKDIVFCVFTGGSSSLAIWPAGSITVPGKQQLNRALLECGASIREINAVRKHVSRIKGGWLGNQVFPATLINLTASDVVGDPVDYITDLTVPDTSTFQDAWATMDKYDLWGRVPSSVSNWLNRGPEIETPKGYTGEFHTIITVPCDAAAKAALSRAKLLGCVPHLLGTNIEGESREQAAAFIAVAREMLKDSPRGERHVVIGSGETVVTIAGERGEGGPNQEFALSAALELEGMQDVALASVGTDGTDGPTDAAGGLVDGKTLGRAVEAGLDPLRSLLLHDAGRLLEVTGDLIVTGPTGTNVNDLIVLLMDL
jgi:glycerate 2-kinase